MSISLPLSDILFHSCLKKVSWNWDKPFQRHRTIPLLLSSRLVFAANNLYVYWCHLVRRNRILYLWVCAELPHEKSLFSHHLSLTYGCGEASEINLKWEGDTERDHSHYQRSQLTFLELRYWSFLCGVQSLWQRFERFLWKDLLGER